MPCDVCFFDYNGSFAPENRVWLTEVLGSRTSHLQFDSGQDITEAIARGCWVCRAIRDALLPFNWYLYPEWHCKHDDLDILGGCKECSRVAEIRFGFHRGPGYGLEIRVYSKNLERLGTFYIIDNGIPWPIGLEPSPTSRIRYLSDLARHSRLDQARAWLDRCTLEHSGCQQSPCSPKRLLEIRDGLDDEPSVRLRSPRDPVKYACLSYCWGQSGNLETLADNLQRHLDGIPFYVLPKTIQDAVRMCLALGIYYLWVDALCIVQDDENDWASECMRMGDIYSGAHVTLAAVQGHHSEAGFLRVKPFKVARIKVWPPTGTPTEALIYRQPKHSFPNFLYRNEHLKQRPLLTRGWVFQELLLSPRVLRFDADELSFECREGRMCECGVAPGDGIFAEYTSTGRRDFSLVENGLVSHLDAFKLWYMMVEQYSSMTLTKQSDRLPAFSAIASKFSRYGGSYYAGIWEQDFISGLKWHRVGWNDGNQVRRRVLSTLTAPSWSWASMLSSIFYDKYTGDRLYSAKISIKRLTLSTGANIFGGVSNGHLDAFGRGKFANLKVRTPSDSKQEEPYELCEWDGKPVKDHAEDNISLYFDGRLAYEDEERLLSTKNSLCCFMLVKAVNGSGCHTDSLILGLVDEKQGLYQRIGIMKESYVWGESWFDDAEEVRILIQ